MITSKQLAELLNFKTPLSAVVSVYLDLGPNRSHIDAMRRLASRAAQPDSPAAGLPEDLDRVIKFVQTELEPGYARGLAVFSSKRFGLWRACPLPEPVKTDLRVEKAPYLAPLLSQADQRHRFGVVLADESRARFLEVYMGQVREYEEFAVAAGDFESEHDYLKSLGDRLDGLSRNQGFQRVVAGVALEMTPKFASHLHSSLQHNLILDAELGTGLSAQAVLERIRDCEDQARRVRETVLVHRLIDAAKSRARTAVLGLDRTLEALQKGQVRSLLARDGFAKMGRRCPGCDRLSLSWTKCPDCGRPTETVFNLVDEMIARALQANCEVFRLLHETPLDNLGRIGAELTCDPPETGSPALLFARPERAAAR